MTYAKPAFWAAHLSILAAVFVNVPLADAEDIIARAERERVAIIAQVAPSVVCVYDEMERGGGSGVLIDEEGNGLTNFHVIAGMLEKRRGLGGLSDGKVYELEVLGIDPTGDVAMFRLLGRDRFPYAKLGNSDAVRLGDAVMAMGNPFVLSEDQTPSVTTGIVTGLHRYQAGVGQNLVYSDCIQTDGSINPGNSGGPLFNRSGEVIGINGRISVNTRGRFNVGFGYAIPANQIRRFIPTLRAGLLARHGTLQATVEQEGPGDVRFASVRPEFAADRAGIRAGDRLTFIDCLDIRTANEFASLMGTYPENWPVSVDFERDGARKEVHIRLDPSEPKLARPFVPDPPVNKREARRVIERYRRRMICDSGGSTAGEETVEYVRHRQAQQHNAMPGATRMSTVWNFDVPAEIWNVKPEGGKSDVIRFDDDEVRGRSLSGEEYAPLMEDSLVLAALYVLQRRLPGSDDLTERDGVRHAGAGGLRRSGACPNSLTRAALGADPVELVIYPILKGGELVLAFGEPGGGLLQILARDKASGIEIIIDIGEGRTAVAGRQLPDALSVRGPTRSYSEQLEVVKGEP